MATKHYKIAVVGNPDAILPFQLVGFDIYPVSSAAEASKQLAVLAKQDYGIVYLTEDLAQHMADVLAYYDTQVTPAIILIPTHQGSLGIGKTKIEANVEKAVGQNIL